MVIIEGGKVSSVVLHDLNGKAIGGAIAGNFKSSGYACLVPIKVEGVFSDTVYRDYHTKHWEEY